MDGRHKWHDGTIQVLTLCSANYLAYAQTLGDSLARYCPEALFTIGLVDKVNPDEPVIRSCPYETLQVEALGITGLDDMIRRYTIVELNTAVKPYYMEFLYQRDASVRAVIYFDPDILICGDLSCILDRLRHNNLVATPHACTYDLDDPERDYELSMLTTGICNLGFLATRRSDVTFAFLAWWQRRLFTHCYYLREAGFFVDQFWFLLAPFFFDGVHIEKHPGLNVAYWNLWERTLSRRANGTYIVNGSEPLIFFHFSSYLPEKPEAISHRPPRLSLAEYPELQCLFDTYRQRLLDNGYSERRNLACHYYTVSSLGVEDEPSRSPLKRLMRRCVQRAPAALKQRLFQLGCFLRNYAE